MRWIMNAETSVCQFRFGGSGLRPNLEVSPSMRIPRDGEQGFHGNVNTDSTAR